ncbi:MAG TPA: FhaA domain-containing protein [Blastocatellia bacterium]|nr:FhaA domain-containing protein [Blastocatellia bacterium]
MANRDDSVIDKAETIARRILERLGSTIDSKLGSGQKQALGPRQVGEINSRIERIIESSLREDKDGVKRVAPNRFKVLFTYEDTSRLAPGYLEALAKELKATIFEFINNRRYETRGPIEVETGSDLFVKTTVIKARFEDDADKPSGLPTSAINAPTESQKRAAGQCTVSFRDDGGRTYRVELKPGGAPAYIGRVAGNAIILDDKSVSRMHCSIALHGNGDVVVADLGSSNGTSVNGQLLRGNEARPINEDDVLGVGDLKLTVSEIS